MTEEYYKGHKIGYDQGLEEGKKVGAEEAKSNFNDRYQEGYDRGYRIGHSEGYDEGESEGSCSCEFTKFDAVRLLSGSDNYHIWQTKTIEDQLKVEALEELFKNATLQQIEELLKK